VTDMPTTTSSTGIDLEVFLAAFVAAMSSGIGRLFRGLVASLAVTHLPRGFSHRVHVSKVRDRTRILLPTEDWTGRDG
jgi:hypothetical protein